MKTIGERVRALREAKGIERQRDLGVMVGVDQSVISDIERGSGFKAHVLMALCEHLETTPEFIMTGDDRHSQGEAELLAIYRNTNEEGRAAMVVMARSLKQSYPRPSVGSARVITEAKSTRPDTLITKHKKSIEISVPDSSKKRIARRDKPSTNTERKPSERGKHLEGSPKTGRARGA
ncbi:transcriptional regulator with XRE-family HTH domain [Variovorax boronicumulans]|uniref:helix-turn-helix domain-containing protein n=1 Tax=Variovorax boronicumulans TaxID=436515 RepID=UPI0027819742|nr:helix-turn-helix domain-containing protein [Variovorax boronicumulans]MDQ0035898.1 transcriptional regulator with XRE-family HTH domain [Variovorax boronicumulans]